MYFSPAPFCGLLLFVTGAELAAEKTDWRMDLLKAEGVDTGPANLQKMRGQFVVSNERLNAAVANLGADDFTVREAAQRDILLMGKKVLPLLRQLPASDDPEVKGRLAEIVKTLSVNGLWSRDDLLRHAITSLVAEQEGGGRNEVFAEFFSQAKPLLDDGYRRFLFASDEGRKGLVKDGMLRLPGDAGVDGDQRLILTARELTGEDEFPDEFRIEAKLGAEAGGAAAFHVGVSVGNVRVLFHPGYRGGGFRFEEIHKNEHLGMNEDMGFTPASNKLQHMSIVVRRVAEQNVLLDVTVASADGEKSYRTGQAIPEHIIGKLDRISLDRSGRKGGDGLFDDFVVDWSGK